MFAVIDVETTGGHVYDDRVTEVAIFITDGQKVIKHFTSLVNPEKSISPFVVKLTGITDDMVSDAPFFKEIAEEIEEITKDCVFVAHNIGFDYNIIKREFKRIGKTYKRPTICTVQLSQLVFKNQPSYSLGNLCENLGISLNDRHRAFGDAEATAFLLHMIVNEKGLDYLIEHSGNNTQNIDFEGNVTQEMVDALPEDPGVFYFVDENNEVLFIKSSRNIFQEVNKFLLKEIQHHRYNGLFKKIHRIDTTLFNSVIIAELQEIEDIRQLKPVYNRAAVYKNYPIGIYENDSPQDRAFYIERNFNDNAIWRFNSEKRARSFLKKWTKDHQIKLPSFPADIEDINRYREKVEEALLKDIFPMRSFFIIREVSFADTIYAIYIEDFIYKGYANVDRAFYDGSLESLKDNLVHCENNPYSFKALKRYIKKKKSLKIIPC